MLLKSSPARGLVSNDGKEGWLTEQVPLDPRAEVELIMTLLQRVYSCHLGLMVTDIHPASRGEKAPPTHNEQLIVIHKEWLTQCDGQVTEDSFEVSLTIKDY